MAVDKGVGKKMQEYVNFWKYYADFTGRASRRDFWMWFLFNILAIIVMEALGAIFHPMIFLVALYSLAVIVPQIAITVRRLHDTSHSGWWVFINLVPLVGPIVLLVFLARQSDGDNQWGQTIRNVY